MYCAELDLFVRIHLQDAAFVAYKPGNCSSAAFIKLDRDLSSVTQLPITAVPCRIAGCGRGGGGGISLPDPRFPGREFSCWDESEVSDTSDVRINWLGNSQLVVFWMGTTGVVSAAWEINLEGDDPQPCLSW